MSNFSPKLENQSDDKLYFLINENDARYGQLALAELTKRTLNKLQENIKIFNEESSRQTQKMITLTQWIVVLTIAMLLGLMIQIILAVIGK